MSFVQGIFNPLFFNWSKLLFEKKKFHQKYPQNRLLMLLAAYLVKKGADTSGVCVCGGGGGSHPFFDKLIFKNAINRVK